MGANKTACEALGSNVTWDVKHFVCRKKGTYTNDPSGRDKCTGTPAASSGWEYEERPRDRCCRDHSKECSYARDGQELELGCCDFCLPGNAYRPDLCEKNLITGITVAGTPWGKCKRCQATVNGTKMDFSGTEGKSSCESENNWYCQGAPWVDQSSECTAANGTLIRPNWTESQDGSRDQCYSEHCFACSTYQHWGPDSAPHCEKQGHCKYANGSLANIGTG